MLQGTICRWKNTPQMPREACLACAAEGRNPCGYNFPLIKLMLRDRDPKTVGCSSTMLEGCPRQHGIQKHYDYYVDPDRAYTRAYGSLAHAGGEYLTNTTTFGVGPQVDAEERYSCQYHLSDGRVVNVTAAMDLLHHDWGNIHTPKNPVRIRDLKLVTSLAPSKIDRKLRSYRIQFSIQRWILHCNDITVESIDLDFMCHDGKRSVNLFPEGDPELVGASLMSLEETEKYLDTRLPALADALDGKLPGVITNPEEFWRCRYCDVADICQSLYGKPLPAL